MRICLQRVRSGRVKIDGEIVGEIGNGVVLLVGFKKGDTDDQIEPMAKRVVNMRIFEDEQDKMNLSLLDLGYSILVVSQFTLYANSEKGRRPSFTEALEPDLAEKYYLRLVEVFRSMNLDVATGKFGAKMLVEIANWGPVTMILDA